ncbi:hypothetical protein BDZ85DRAFT_286522 [Elsinoe ampelina]|uniref:Uncharacterized protein n=1 Tax=Elsinoe ampelina TaxID=302913 RepID=A0A6A6FXV8_9PEZI|nr:hypothetical protein BDZ85DRAFT_286522 [Elsinoe ampelina]
MAPLPFMVVNAPLHMAMPYGQPTSAPLQSTGSALVPSPPTSSESVPAEPSYGQVDATAWELILSMGMFCLLVISLVMVYRMLILWVEMRKGGNAPGGPTPRGSISSPTRFRSDEEDWGSRRDSYESIKGYGTIAEQERRRDSRMTMGTAS